MDYIFSSSWLTITFLGVIIICSIITGLIAKRKNRNVVGWVLFAIFFGLIALVIITSLPPKGERKNILKVIGSVALLAIILFLIIASIRTFVVKAYKIPSGAMMPTLQPGDRIFVTMFNYKTKMPKRGEIVVFKYPEDPKKDFIKRVIAVEGDTVRIINKRVYVNGIALNEPYKIHNDPNIYPYSVQNPRDNLGIFQVPKDHLFMLGDNRDQSLDSRYWGFVPKKNLRGKAVKIYWPRNRTSAL